MSIIANTHQEHHIRMPMPGISFWPDHDNSTVGERHCTIGYVYKKPLVYFNPAGREAAKSDDVLVKLDRMLIHTVTKNPERFVRILATSKLQNRKHHFVLRFTDHVVEVKASGTTWQEAIDTAWQTAMQLIVTTNHSQTKMLSDAWVGHGLNLGV